MFKAGDTIKINGEFVLEDKGEGWFEIGGIDFCEEELLVLGAVKVRREYSTIEISKEFRSLDADSLRVIVEKSLDFLRRDARRSKTECIHMAMGYVHEDGLIYKEGEE